MATVNDNAAPILALLSTIELHASEARRAASAAILLAPKAGKPRLKLATPADEFRMMNGHVPAAGPNPADQALAHAGQMERAHVNGVLKACADLTALLRSKPKEDGEAAPVESGE